MSNRINNNMTELQLDHPIILHKLVPRRPARLGLMSRMVLIRDLPKRHQRHLIVAIAEDLRGAVVAAGDVRPDCFAEGEDFW